MNKKAVVFLSSFLLVSSAFTTINPSIGFAKSTKQEVAQATQLYKQGFDNYKKDDIKSAAQNFIDAAKTDKENPLYELFSADMLRMMKQYPSSNRYYLDSISHIKHADKNKKDKILLKAYIGLSQNYANLKDTTNAVDYANKAIKEFPDNYRGYFALGNIYSLNQNTYNEAIAQYKLSIEKDKEQLDSYLSLASLYNKQGKMDDIIDTYKQACDYRPLDEALKMSLAQVYFSYKDKDGKNNHYKEASLVLKDIINVNQNNSFAHYYLALAYVLMGDRDNAENELGIVNNLNQNLGNRLMREMNAYYKKHSNDSNNNNEINDDSSKKDGTIDVITINENDIDKDNTFSKTSAVDNKENTLVSKQLDKMKRRENISI